MFFKDVILNRSVAIPEQFSLFPLCKWNTKQGRLEAICDPRNKHFFELAGTVYGLPELAFPESIFVVTDRKLDIGALTRCLQVTCSMMIIALDVSNTELKVEGADLIAQFVSTNEILLSLNVSHNDLRSAGLTAIANVLNQTSLTQLNIAGNNLLAGNSICGIDQNGAGKHDTSGLVALAKSIGNLKELDISNNFLKAEGAKILAPAINANLALASLNLANNFLTGDFPYNDMSGITAIAGALPKW
jgi:hypothetical protein